MPVLALLSHSQHWGLTHWAILATTSKCSYRHHAVFLAQKTRSGLLCRTCTATYSPWLKHSTSNVHAGGVEHPPRLARRQRQWFGRSQLLAWRCYSFKRSGEGLSWPEICTGKLSGQHQRCHHRPYWTLRRMASARGLSPLNRLCELSKTLQQPHFRADWPIRRSYGFR